MNELTSLISRHGYAVLALLVFLEALGFPIPAALALVTAGAAAALHRLTLASVLATGIFFIMLGDTILFFLGRKMGWWLLGVLCRLAVNPETCILRSAESFYRRGRMTLMVAKFIPGINTMAPPLAGSMKMSLGQFLRLDLVGCALYVSAYVTLGYLFSQFFEILARGLATVGHTVGSALVIAVLVYMAYRFYLCWQHRVYRVVPRVQVQELADKLRADSDGLIVADVRSHGYYDSGAQRIRHSIRLEPNNLAAATAELPKEKLIFLYCT
ncbi:MAG TPA: VTT domain-containing protein [Terriglobales bacterium]|nr:VTT domain-containing protein [Terriglobales bacterium]